jgi:hypothetical protein
VCDPEVVALATARRGGRPSRPRSAAKAMRCTAPPLPSAAWSPPCRTVATRRPARPMADSAISQ